MNNSMTLTRNRSGRVVIKDNEGKFWTFQSSVPDVRFWHIADIPEEASGIGEINEKRSYLHRFPSPGNGPVLGGPGRGLDSLARRELHGERAAMDLLRRRHRRDRACPDPAGASIIASPFHPAFCFRLSINVRFHG